MPTSANVTNLKINKLTSAQFDTAVQGGIIGANEISILTDLDESIQVSTMPTASVDEVGKVYQYIGATGTYTHGYFYECVSDGGNPATYSWEEVEVQAGSVDIDNSTITKNSNDLLQAVATINKNTATGATNTVYDWVGTTAEYNAQDIENQHPEWVCYITDDISGGTSVYTKAEVDNIAVTKANVATTYTKTETDNALKALLPPGTVVPWAGINVPPTGYLYCDGSAISRTMYADLFAAIGTYYGAGDGSTTFNIPNYTAYREFSGTISIISNGSIPKYTTTNTSGFTNKSLQLSNQNLSWNAACFSGTRVLNNTGSDIIVGNQSGLQTSLTTHARNWIIKY